MSHVVFGLSFVVLVATLFVRSTVAVQCYSCNSVEVSCSNPSTCTGASCSNGTISINGRTVVIRACETLYKGPVGCSYTTIQGMRMYACACHGDYCNGPSSLVTVRPVTDYPPVTCYQCNSADGSCSNPPTCQGQSCVKMTGWQNGVKVTVLGCDPSTRSDECMDMEIAGVNMRACSCINNYCNSVSATFDKQTKQPARIQAADSEVAKSHGLLSAPVITSSVFAGIMIVLVVASLIAAGVRQQRAKAPFSMRRLHEEPMINS